MNETHFDEIVDIVQTFGIIGTMLIVGYGLYLAQGRAAGRAPAAARPCARGGDQQQADRQARRPQMTERYILKGHKPVPEPNLMKWGRWMEDGDRQVAETIQGDVRVSTVFIGLDHSFGHGPPLLFETMAFSGTKGAIGVGGHHIEVHVAMFDGESERYSTWDEAEAGHKRWVMKVFKPTPIIAMPE